MVREVKKDEAFNYLKKAEEFTGSAQDNFIKGRFNAAGFDATQAIINSNDALTIFFLEKRASSDHREAIKLHIDVIRTINDNFGRAIIKNALDMRSAAGYLGETIGRADAENLIKSAIKFAEWVKRYVK